MKSKTIQLKDSYANLPQNFYSTVKPQSLQNSNIVHFNAKLAREFAYSQTQLEMDDQFKKLLQAQISPPNSKSIATVYSGHQFGSWAGQLGDGRALILGEAQTQQGKTFEFQLKGSGLTPYSRMGDGRAVLRSSIREYLCSEAMYNLGIPTSRALSLVSSDEAIQREYSEPGAIVCRLTETHIRFGHFEHFYYNGQHDDLKTLADYVIQKFHPHMQELDNPYAAMYEYTIQATAKLLAKWQSVGFCHGVMNTDNMSILGLTIDYGPFGFLDHFDSHHICNSSDYTGRYAFDKQPSIASWNLMALAQALTPLVDQDKLQEALNQFFPIFNQESIKIIRAKLGLNIEIDNDYKLFEKLREIMQTQSMDYTLTFRELSNYRLGQAHEDLLTLSLIPEKFQIWLDEYDERLKQETEYQDKDRRLKMKAINPKYILRNYMLEDAIAQAYTNNNFTELDQLFRVMQNPFDEQPEFSQYAELPPNWAKDIKVSCSS